MQSWWWWWWWWWWWRLRNTAYTHVIYEVSFIGQTAYVRLSYLIGRTVGGAAVSTVLAESVFACFQFVTFSACGLGTAVVLSSRCCRDRLVFRWIESDYSACSISHLWVDVWVWGQSRCHICGLMCESGVSHAVSWTTVMFYFDWSNTVILTASWWSTESMKETCEDCSSDILLVLAGCSSCHQLTVPY